MTEILQTKKDILAKKSHHNAFKLALADLGHEDKMEQALTVILLDISSKTCSFCDGSGHDARRCSSKKAVDKATADLPGLKILWGSLKSKYKSTGKQTSAVNAGSKRLHHQKDIVSKRFRNGQGSAANGSAVMDTSNGIGGR